MHLRGGKGKKDRERTAARRAKSRNAGNGGGDEVGLPYQTSTPLLDVNEDIPQTRNARSYAAEAARCLAELEPDAALACYEEALKLEPHACWLLDAYGGLLADLGRVDEALDAFNASYTEELQSPSGPSSHIRHMYLGQAILGEEGIKHLRMGVQILEEKVRAQTAAGDADAEGAAAAAAAGAGYEDWEPKLCAARCALAELLLANDDTGAADEEAALQLQLAMDLNPDSPDPHQGFAGLRLSQGRAEEAGEYMQSVLRILAETADECMPAIDFRMQTAKLLIELGLPQDAIKVLRRVEKERDDIGELWYLLCYAYRLANNEVKVQECARKGKRYLRSVGGREQARHPITGEELSTEDFEDIVRGVGTTEQDVVLMEREEEESRRRDVATAQRAQRMEVDGGRDQAEEEEEDDDDDDEEDEGASSSEDDDDESNSDESQDT